MYLCMFYGYLGVEKKEKDSFHRQTSPTRSGWLFNFAWESIYGHSSGVVGICRTAFILELYLI